MKSLWFLPISTVNLSRTQWNDEDIPSSQIILNFCFDNIPLFIRTINFWILKFVPFRPFEKLVISSFEGCYPSIFIFIQASVSLCTICFAQWVTRAVRQRMESISLKIIYCVLEEYVRKDKHGVKNICNSKICASNFSSKFITFYLEK